MPIINTTETRQHYDYAKTLRRTMTKQECILWFHYLQKYPIRVRRQVCIGPYIVDFCCEKARLIIEIDGGQHYEPEERAKDEERSAYLESLGYKVIRLSNLDVTTRLAAAGEYIDLEIRKRIEKRKKVVRCTPPPSADADTSAPEGAGDQS